MTAAMTAARDNFYERTVVERAISTAQIALTDRIRRVVWREVQSSKANLSRRGEGGGHPW